MLEVIEILVPVPSLLQGKYSPFSVPQFGKDGIIQNCDFCLETGRDPACVISCPAEALYRGTIDEFLKMAPEKTIETMDGTIGPSMIIIKQATS